jgi:hypothetical protein
MDDFVIMRLVGQDVRIFCEMNSSYRKYVVIENGQEVLYVRLLKALYGCVKSAILWYKLFTGHLKHMNFELNPYDPCVANAMIDGKQCTIVWFVDDNKISHLDHNVVTRIIESIEGKFGKMSVTRGKKHVFLGMDIQFTENRTVEIQMVDYLKEAIEESELNIGRTYSTPARRDLFDVDEDSPLLVGHDAEVFHSVVAKLLYVSLRARMDILLPVIFLCTRVSCATVEDRLKLRRVLQYVKGSLDLKYTLGADDLRKFRSWVDASYAVHPDMRSHTGGAISFGTGGLVCKSAKQKLNTKSSTESEVVGASDYLPNSIWVKFFMEAQGHRILESWFEQDNQSAMKLEMNGKSSSGARTRHINIRYFFIKDRTAAEGIKIRHCPTLQMLADFFTKPLQGSLFRRFRAVLLGYEHVDSLALPADTAAQERVGERPTDAPTAASDDNEPGEDPVQPKKVTWAQVVAGNTGARTARTKQNNAINPAKRLILSKQSR